MHPPSRSLEHRAEPQRRVQDTLNPSTQTVSTTPSNETSPAMSAGKQKQKHKDLGALQSVEAIRSEDVLGQFSYAPATQTTVVTTTTTTTTNFPPLMMKAPQHLYDLDSKLYPLASSPTPHSIKKLCFDVEGRPTIFQEADDTLQAIQKVCLLFIDILHEGGNN